VLAGKILEEALAMNFLVPVEVKIEQPRHDEAALAADLQTRLALEILANIIDAVSRKGDVTVSNVFVALGVPCSPFGTILAVVLATGLYGTPTGAAFDELPESGGP
jgi:hypothetical protein